MLVTWPTGQTMLRRPGTTNWQQSTMGKRRDKRMYPLGEPIMNDNKIGASVHLNM
jgi:hypothetical protein